MNSPNRRKELYREIGRLIREAREKKKFSQVALARAVSLSRSSIANIEAGRQNLLVHTLIDVALALDVPAAALIPQKAFAEAVRATLPEGLGAHEEHWIKASLVKRRRRARGD